MHPLLKQLVAGLTCVTSIFGIWNLVFGIWYFTAWGRSALCRFEWLEIIVRMGKAKYYDSGAERTPAAAVGRLIREVLSCSPRIDATEFRESTLRNPVVRAYARGPSFETPLRVVPLC